MLTLGWFRTLPLSNQAESITTQQTLSTWNSVWLQSINVKNSSDEMMNILGGFVVMIMR